MKIYTLLAIGLILTGCVSYPLVTLDGPGGVIQGEDSTGLIFNQPGKDNFVLEGVPATWFTPLPNNEWHLLFGYWHPANTIRADHKNKLPISPTPTPRPGS